MTDLKISKALALAIGWKPEQMRFHKAQNGYEWMTILVRDFEQYGPYFDYRDWNVTGPIAARYNTFPIEDAFGCWFSAIGTQGKNVSADTPQKAIALAVIKGAKK
jgi:hypothetical protein